MITYVFPLSLVVMSRYTTSLLRINESLTTAAHMYIHTFPHSGGQTFPLLFILWISFWKLSKKSNVSNLKSLHEVLVANNLNYFKRCNKSQVVMYKGTVELENEGGVLFLIPNYYSLWQTRTKIMRRTKETTKHVI